MPPGDVSRNVDAAPHASPTRSASVRIASKSTASGPSSRNVSSRTPGIARYRTPAAVAARRAALEPMNRLVSSITAPASRIAAATAPGGSAPGSSGTGILETIGIASTRLDAGDESLHDVGVRAGVGQQDDLFARTQREATVQDVGETDRSGHGPLMLLRAR